MMTRDALGDLWQGTLEVLERELPTPSFEAWIRPTHPVMLQGDILVVGVPSELACETLRSRYAAVMIQTLRAVSEQSLSLEFVVEADVRRRSQAGNRPPASAARTTAAAPVRTENPSPTSDPDPVSAPVLRERYTFDTFVVGNSNRLAHAAAQAVAQNPARAYNPLFLYGGVGLGKTHLMHAIGHAVEQHSKNKRVLYVPAETFTNELINAIRDDTTPEFRARYRGIDLLLIDDIQFISGKERTQEEFFHTFEALHGAQKQLVISSDRPPKNLTTLEERLRSRFEWGLITDIQPPDFETRMAILQKKANLENIDLSDRVLAYIAGRIETNIRELEGALIRLAAHASLHQVQMTEEMAQYVLKDILPPERQRRVTVNMIKRAVAQQYGLEMEDMVAKRRTRAVAFPRQVAMYLVRQLTDLSLPRIGEEFGGRDHTTVIHAVERVQAAISENQDLANTILSLSETVRRSANA